MSNLLKEAIVDANALRNAALKNAESTIIDKYSDEVRQTLTTLLEQDELGALGDLGAMDAGGGLEADPAAMGAPLGAEEVIDEELEEDVEDVPYGATDGMNKMKGKNLKNLPSEGDPVEVELDLGSLRESVEALQAEIDEELTFNEDDLANMLSEEDGEPESDLDPEEDPLEDPLEFPTGTEDEPEYEISEELISSIVEKLTVDLGASLSGWAGRPDFQKKEEIEKELARRRSTDVEEELKILKKAQEELVFENKQLNGRLSQYEQVTGELKETLQNVNLSNARLLYTNRVLRNPSLNERQKKRIAEAISKADSVTEAKTIHNTLESAVEAKPKRSPQSLSEAISRPSSVIRASRKETQPTDPFAERMRRLAGIK
tara:strand:- start:1072 stop:2196 length:1125 start_codon:yes stop_codon:yes gene_type:complete